MIFFFSHAVMYLYQGKGRKNAKRRVTVCSQPHERRNPCLPQQDLEQLYFCFTRLKKQMLRQKEER